MKACLVLFSFLAGSLLTNTCSGYSAETPPSRRAFLAKAAVSSAALLTASTVQNVEPAQAAPTIYKLDSGIKYAITKDSAADQSVRQVTRRARERRRAK